MKRILRVISVLVVCLALLCLYSYAVTLSVNGKKDLGVFDEPLKTFATFPQTVQEVLSSKEIQNIPPTYTNADASFEQLNQLDYDLYGLNSFYNRHVDCWDIRLFNFKNDSVVYSWHLDKSAYNYVGSDKQFANAEPRNCIILPDSSLLLANDESKNLYRIDKDSKVMWHTTSRWFHHSLNLDAEGNLWVGTQEMGTVNHFRQTHVHEVLNDYLTQIDVETGEVIWEKRVSQILMDNGYINFVYGFGNKVVNRYSKDPLHLNDIEPALKDGPYWKKGDLLISLRHRSLVFLYRPSTNKVLRLIYGPFLNQHDVDVVSDSTIAIFNNNVSTVGRWYENMTYGKEVVVDSLDSTEILIYNFRDSTFSKHLKEQFLREKIFSYTEGEQEILPNGDTYVESQNDGKMYIMNEDEVLVKKVFDTDIDGMIEQPHWLRIYTVQELPIEL